MRVWILATAAMLVSTLATAQSEPTVRVAGVVVDTTGAAIPEVAVEAVTGARMVVTRSSAQGDFELLVGRGETELTFMKRGFQPAIIRVSASTESQPLRVTLQIGSITETTVVTATRREVQASELTGSVSVFDAAAIRARGARSVAEVLQQTPGLQIEATGREGALTSLFARGGESDYNLVLINGVRVTLPGGRFDFSRIDANQIERVEVVRGSQSALYGSEAIGAVVQVFTRAATATQPPQLFGSLEGGAFGTVRGGAGFSAGFGGRADVHVAGSYRGSNGAFADLLPERDRFDQRSFDVAAGVRLGGGVETRSSVRYGSSRGRSVGAIAYGLYDTGTFYDTRDVNFDLRVSHTAPRFRQEASVGIFDYDNFTGDDRADGPWSFYGILEGTIGANYPDSPRLVRQISLSEFNALRVSGNLPSGQFLASRAAIVDFPSAGRMDAERRSFRYQADVAWSPQATLFAGYDFDAEQDPNAAIVQRDNHALFAQQQFNVGGRVFLNAGARVDDNSRYGTEWSPKFSGAAFLVPFRAGTVSSVKIQGNVGHGIKNPVFAELFSAFVDGNPNLDPEKANTLDLGTETTFVDQRFAVVATWFRNRYEDQVAFRSSGPGLDGIPDYINIEGSRADGAELEFRLQRPVGGTTLSGFYTFVDTEVTTTVSTSQQFQPGQPLLRRPRHSWNIIAGWTRGRVSLNAGVRHVGQRHDAAFLSLTTDPAAGVARAVDITVNPGYTVLNANGEYRVHEALAFFVRLDNLADETYESALGYPGLPRSVSAGFRFNLAAR